MTVHSEKLARVVLVFVLALALGTLLAGCRREAAPSPSPSSRVFSLSSAAIPASSTSAARGVAKPSPASVKPTPIDRKAYGTALSAGRTATREHRYEDAVLAFGNALNAFPNEPRALAERGYAELLAEQLEPAAADLTRARDLGPDRRLTAQIWFNLGLLAEKRSDDAAARDAFARSALLVPTGAAKGKLAARATCGAVVERRADTDKPDLLQPRLLLAQSWLDAYQQLYSGNDPKAEPEPEDEASAKLSLCVRLGIDRCESPAPWALSRYLNSALGELEDRIFPEANGKLLVYHAGMVERRTDVTDLNQLSCVTEQTFTVQRLPGLLQVSISTERHEWQDQGTPPEHCTSGPGELEDVIYDTSTYRELARVTRSNEKAAPTLTIAQRNLELSAGSCHVSIPLNVGTAH